MAWQHGNSVRVLEAFRIYNRSVLSIRMDISSLVSQEMISGLELVGWYVVIRERENDLTATLERMAYNSPAGTWGALVDNIADATPRTDAQSFCSVPDR